MNLFNKYTIAKSDGSPVDPNARYFVLRLDGTDKFAEASRFAAAMYAEIVDEQEPEFASHIRELVEDCHRESL